MKNFLTALFLIIIFGVFSAFIIINDRSKTVLEVITPVKLAVDLDGNKTIDSDENICIADIEAFSLEMSDEFFNKYSKKFKLNKIDMISLGYLASEFAQKTLENQKITIKYTPKVTNECKYADVFINGINYKDTLKYSGFGIINGEISSVDKFKAHLEKAKKLNLVVLNHHSGKFHTLDCPYGDVAHDKVIIPKKQLPKGAKPCKFCHTQKEKSHKKVKIKKDIDIFNIPKIPQPALSVSDGNVRVYFTDYTKNLTPNANCNTTVCREFIKLVDNTSKTIDLAFYGYDDIPLITSALSRAKARGVNIRYVYDTNVDTNKDFYKSNSKIIELSNSSRSDKSGSKTLTNMIMHNKFTIFDGKTVYTGSMNFSKSGLSGYDVNDVVIINSAEVAALYTKEFEQMLNGKFHTQKQKLNLPNRFTIGSSVVEIYFSPKDNQSTRIVELIKSAKNYIYIPAFLITHKDISSELINAKTRGVDVRLILDANSTTTRNSKHATLRQNGILLKTENYAGKLHAKVMIIDDEYLITGSMNFSNSGENKNDENTVIIKNSKIAKAHKDFFLYLWTMVPNKYLKHNAPAEGKDSIGSCSDGVDNNFNGKIDKEEALCR